MPADQDTIPQGHAGRGRTGLLLLAGTLVAVPALLPLVVGFLPVLYFDRDPRGGFDPALIADLGPAGAAVWHAACLVGATAALALYRLLGGRLHGPSVALVAVGFAAACWQGTRHADNLTTLGGWIAGASLALAAVHVGRFDTARRWMAALVVAVMLPVGLQAGYDVLVQKPRDIAWYHANEQEQLALKGIRPGSPQHQLLTRRAESMDATGPFGFSNALGTVTGGGAVLALGLGLGYGFHRRRGPAVAAFTAAVCAGVGLWFTHSTGAQGAVVLAVSLCALVAWLAKTKARRVVPYLALALLALPLIAVLLRGAVGPPETMAGERSLLFRFHYWQASARMVLDGGPSAALLGVGPTGFQRGYLVHKNPLNPEDVASAHSVMIDWVTVLGLGGLAWTVAVLWWLAVSARGAAHPREDDPPAGEGDDDSQTPGEPPVRLLERPHVLAALGCAAVLFGTQYAVQQAMIDIELALLWIAGVVGFVAVAVVVGEAGPSRGPWLRLGLLGMALAVLVHSQIEMGFALMATAAPVWFLVGLAGAGPRQAPEFDAARHARPALLALVVGLLAVVAVVIGYTAPVVGHQQHLREASVQLTAEQPYRALASLEQAADTLPTDETAPRWIATLRRDEMLGLLAGGDEAGARRALALALEPVDRQIASGHASTGVLRLRAGLLLEAADALHDPGLRRRGIDAYRQLPALSPYNLRDAVTLGDLLAEEGDTDGAAEAYRRALEIDRQRYLDDATQLDDATRERLNAWLDRHAAGR